MTEPIRMNSCRRPYGPSRACEVTISFPATVPRARCEISIRGTA